MRTLIHSRRNDAHTVGVQTCLQNWGHQVDIWYVGNFPSHQTISIEYASSTYNNNVADELYKSELNGAYDICWNRRRERIQTAGEMIDDIDREFVSSEIRSFVNAALPLIGKSSFWVNDENQSLAAENKFLQLRVAQDVGFKIPTTLASNSPDDVRAFVKDQKRAIYKPMRGHAWKSKGGKLSLFVNTVSMDDLEDDHVLKACPGIYQEYVEKAFEVRVVVMGDEITSCAIHARDHTDWRFDQAKGNLVCSHYELPLAIKEKCLALVKSLGLVFGCIDLIVTPDNQHVFLENNEAGQFLWMEEVLPDLPLLDKFSRFLNSGDSNFQYCSDSQPVRWHELKLTEEFGILWGRNRRESARVTQLLNHK